MFNATTHERLTDIDVKGMRDPSDIAACEQTSRLYVVDSECVWRVSSDGEDVKRWLSKPRSETLTPWKLSVASARLLVTSDDTRQLIQFDADGEELRRVRLPDFVEPRHAVESPAGTFVVSHRNAQLERQQIVEVDAGGRVLRQFTGPARLPLGWTQHLAIDSRGNVLVADRECRCVLLLDARLALRRVVVDERQLSGVYERPQRLCYRERSGQLLVGFYRGGVAVFDVLRR